MKRAYLVETSKGDALFLDESRAMEYAAKNHGIFIRMYGVADNNAVSFNNCKDSAAVMPVEKRDD